MYRPHLLVAALGLVPVMTADAQVARPMVGGIQVYCQLAPGVPVLSYSANINDIAIARYDGNVPVMVFHATAFPRLPDPVQRFIYGHECMHHLLGHAMTPLNLNREVDADCESMKLLRRQRLITRQLAIQAASYFRNNPPMPPFYPSGPERAARIVACFDSSDDVPNTMDEQQSLPPSGTGGTGVRTVLVALERGEAATARLGGAAVDVNYRRLRMNLFDMTCVVDSDGLNIECERYFEDEEQADQLFDVILEAIARETAQRRWVEDEGEAEVDNTRRSGFEHESGASIEIELEDAGDGYVVWIWGWAGTDE